MGKIFYDQFVGRETTNSVRGNFSNITYVQMVRSAREKYAMVLLPKKEEDLLDNGLRCGKEARSHQLSRTHIYTRVRRRVEEILDFLPVKKRNVFVKFSKNLYILSVKLKAMREKVINCVLDKF